MTNAEIKLTHSEWMYPHYHSLTPSLRAKVDNQTTGSGSTRARDICSNFCQMFANVGHTFWMKEMIAEEMIAEGLFGKQRQELYENMPDVLALSLSDRKSNKLYCAWPGEPGEYVNVADKIRELVNLGRQ